MLKVDLHIHTGDDPVDPIPYTTDELIERAAALGFDALAITLHDHQLDLARFAAHAEERGLVLIPGVERTIEGKHVLLLNFARGSDDVRTFDDLKRLRRNQPGLVVAPHPFFPTSSCLQGQLTRYADLFDAVEWNAMFTSAANFNRRARRWAQRFGKPMVGNGDVHRLRQLGTTCSLIDAERNADAICAAVAAGRVRVETRALSPIEAAAILADMLGPRWISRSQPAAAPAPIHSR